MKIYIKSSTSTSVFKTNTTGMSFYDDFLDPSETDYLRDYKNLKGEIVQMSPNEYFQECATKVFKGKSVESIKQSREASRTKDGTRLVDLYKQMMADGTQFDMCMINYAGSTQEGLHRMYAAGELLGWDTKFPVLVVTNYDEERARRQALWDEAKDFIRYDFKHVCELAEEHIIDEYDNLSAIPNNAVDIFRAEIIKCAKLSGQDWEPCDIDVLIDRYMKDGNVKYACWVAEYNGIEFDLKYKDVSYPNYEVWEDDIFWVVLESDLSYDDKDANSTDLDLLSLDEIDDDFNLPLDEWMAKYKYL